MLDLCNFLYIKLSAPLPLVPAGFKGFMPKRVGESMEVEIFDTPEGIWPYKQVGEVKMPHGKGRLTVSAPIYIGLFRPTKDEVATSTGTHAGIVINEEVYGVIRRSGQTGHIKTICKRILKYPFSEEAAYSDADRELLDFLKKEGLLK